MNIRESIQQALAQPVDVPPDPGMAGAGPPPEPEGPPVGNMFGDQSARPAAYENASVSEEPASDEEQRVYEALSMSALEFVFAEGTSEKVIEGLQAVPDDQPYEAIARVSATIMQAVIQQAKQAGEQVDFNSAFEAGTDVVEAVAEVAVLTGLAQETPDLLEKALTEATRYYGEGALEDPEMRGLQDEAANYLAAGVAAEVDAGEVEPGALSKSGSLPPMKTREP